MNQKNFAIITGASSDLIQQGHPEHWDQMIDTNVKGLLNITRLVLPYMIANQRGHIVNVGSVAGRWVYRGGGVCGMHTLGL